MRTFTKNNLYVCLILVFFIFTTIACEDQSVNNIPDSIDNASIISQSSPTLAELQNQTDEELATFYLNAANLVYEDYDTYRDNDRYLLEEESKKLYQLAAQYGSLEAHYLLTYRYIPESRESEIKHLQFAASRGHIKALESLSETLIFRCDSLDYFDPQLVLDTFNDALQYHPSLKDEIANFDLESSYFDYQLPGRYKLIEMCCELLHGLEPFDVQAFRNTYGITEEEENEIYGTWLLAEQASIEDGRFGERNQTLVYHLVLRGGGAPMEYVGALQNMHDAWKTGKKFTFDICTYMTSSVGAGLCASRLTKRSIETYQANIESIAESVQGAFKDKVIEASEVYLEFVVHKVYNEEGHDGSWKYIWASSSLTRQIEHFVELLQSVSQKKYELKLSNDYETIDRELNSFYKQYISLSKENKYPEEESIRTTQRLWILYRDSAAECLSILDSKISIVEWKTWLTEMRVKQLQGVELK